MHKHNNKAQRNHFPMKKEGGNGTLGREKDKEILYVLRFSEKK